MYCVDEDAYATYGTRYAVWDSNTGNRIIRTNDRNEAINAADHMNKCLVAQEKLLMAAKGLNLT